jgi:thiol-disulfide isomerase/thioredoxin
MPTRIPRPLLATALLIGVLLPAIAGRADSPGDPKWLARLDPLDRSLLEELVSYAPPAFAADLTWLGVEKRTWESLRGKVVVVQSWTNRTSAGRKALTTTGRILAPFGEDVETVFLHTPDGADKLQRYLDRRRDDLAVVLDSRGDYCDALGIYREPVNFVVDRNGAVRFVGLNPRGLKAAVTRLVAQTADPSVQPPRRAEPEAAPPVEYPAVTGPVSNAIDFRGRPAPDFYVAQWHTARPDPQSKVVVLDYWATWCAPCVKSIPHMNALAAQFADDACFVGISDESPGSFQQGLAKIKVPIDYAMAIDTSARMKRAMNITGIPHCVVISSDWVVRWQGLPIHLDAETLGQIIAANGGGEKPSRRKRWEAARGNR